MSEQIQKTLHLSTGEASYVLGLALRAGENILLSGAPGVGKTSIAMDMAAAMGFETIVSYPAHQESVDAKGMPKLNEEGYYEFVPVAEQMRILNATKPTMLLLEDLGQASRAMQSAYMPLLSARTLCGRRIPDCVTIVATTNGRKHKANVEGLLEPVKSRFSTIIEVDVSVDEWLEWAMAKGMPARLLQYIRYNPSMLHCPNPTLDIVNSPNPRTVASLGRWVKLFEKQEKTSGVKVPGRIKLSTYSGAVGAEFAGAYLSFEETLGDMVDPEEVLLNPKTCRIPKDSGALLMLNRALAFSVSNATFANAIEFANRLFDENKGELASSLMRECLTRHPELTETAEFINLSTGPMAEMLQ